jgi:hypothetical protein
LLIASVRINSGNATSPDLPLVGQRRNDLIDMGCSQGVQFFVRAILNGMWHPDISGVESQIFGLYPRRLNKFRGGDANCGDASPFKIAHIMRTARCAAASIGQAFHDHINFVNDRLFDFLGRGACYSGFAVALDSYAAPFQQGGDSFDEDVSAHLGYIQDTNGQTIQ